MTVENLLVTIIAVLPGYLGFATLRFSLSDDDRGTWEIIARSIVISMIAVLPVLLLAGRIEVLGEYRDRVLGPEPLAIVVLWGVVAHVAAALALSGLLAKILTSRRFRDFSRVVFSGAWDWMWFYISKEPRYVMVHAEQGTYHGALVFAGSQRAGGGLVLKDPSVLSGDNLIATDAEFLLFTDKQIHHVEVTRRSLADRSEQGE